MIFRNCGIDYPKIVKFFSIGCVTVGFVMDTDEDEKTELTVPESCPKCGKGAFYRMSPDEPWLCYFCDPPPIVKQMQGHQRNEI